MAHRVKLLFVHQFSLPSISGVTVMISELLRLMPTVDPPTRAGHQGYEGLREPADLLASLRLNHPDATCVVGVNLHIEVGWDHTLALARWCETNRIPFYLHAHDYWPHHRQGVAILTDRFRARLLATTPSIADALASDGFTSAMLPVGVSIPDNQASPVATWPESKPRTVASVGRLVPRKRFPDVVRAFCLADLGPLASLYLRVPPSLVYSREQDAERLREIHREALSCQPARSILVDPQPRLGIRYGQWFVYVSASEYEGLSMTPIESVTQGCPPLVSDIAPHRAIIGMLFPRNPGDFMFPPGDHKALARLLRDEFRTERRRAELAAHWEEIQETATRAWSLRATARAFAHIAHVGEIPSAVPDPLQASGSELRRRQWGPP